MIKIKTNLLNKKFQILDIIIKFGNIEEYDFEIFTENNNYDQKELLIKTLNTIFSTADKRYKVIFDDIIFIPKNYTDSDYYGMPEKEDNNGYKTTKFEAKNTQKEQLSDMEYMGGSKNDIDKASSYEAIYNSTINDINESLLHEREPTNSSTKVANGKDAIKITKEKDDCVMKTYRNINNYDKISSNPPSKQMINMNSSKYEKESDRLDSVIVSEFEKNPYTQSLHSF